MLASHCCRRRLVSVPLHRRRVVSSCLARGCRTKLLSPYLPKCVCVFLCECVQYIYTCERLWKCSVRKVALCFGMRHGLSFVRKQADLRSEENKNAEQRLDEGERIQVGLLPLPRLASSLRRLETEHGYAVKVRHHLSMCSTEPSVRHCLGR